MSDLKKTKPATWFDSMVQSTQNYLEQAKGIIKRNLDKYDGVPTIPSDDPDDAIKLGNYVEQLWKDSRDWKKQSLQNRTRNSYSDIVDYWKDCRKLLSGNHWEVWGRRNQTLGDEWKAELQDDEIANQIRTKVGYIAGNWHDIIVMPNIKNINEVLDQERSNDWSKEIRNGVWKMKVEGTAHWKVTLELNDQGEPVFKERLCDNESIFPTPYSRGLERSDGCYYMAYANMLLLQDIKRKYPNLDMAKVAQISGEKMRDITIQTEDTLASYEKTKMSDEIQFYLDDDTLIDAPVDEQAIQSSIEQLRQGQIPKVEMQQNHLAFIQAYTDFVKILQQGHEQEGLMQQEHMEEQPEMTQQSQDIQIHLMQIVQLVQDQIEKHIKELEKLESQNVPIGKLKKYPFGRYIATVGGVVADDKPNPYLIDWRMLFHKCDNEVVAGSYWGRSDVEILWDANKYEDTAKSYVADIALSIGMPKAYFHEDDKKNVGKDFNNNPLDPAFYTVHAPIFAQGHAPAELFQLYQMTKKDASERLGVNSTTRGESPGGTASAKLVQTLIRQNQPLVAGESNANLNDCVERMIKSRLHLMKEFYKTPRVYYIDGIFKAINVSRLLSVQQVKTETGVIEEEIPLLQVIVKPNSNFPNEWESELEFLMGLYSVQRPDGSPLIPAEALYDSLAQRFPKLSREGEYYQLSQATAIGLQVMAQQEAQKKQIK